MQRTLAFAAIINECLLPPFGQYDLSTRDRTSKHTLDSARYRRVHGTEKVTTPLNCIVIQSCRLWGSRHDETRSREVMRPEMARIGPH